MSREFRATAYEGLSDDDDFVLIDRIVILVFATMAPLRHAAEHKLSYLNVKHTVGITQMLVLCRLASKSICLKCCHSFEVRAKFAKVREVRRELRATAYEGLGQDYDFVLNDTLGMLALAPLHHAAEHKLSDLQRETHSGHHLNA